MDGFGTELVRQEIVHTVEFAARSLLEAMVATRPRTGPLWEPLGQATANGGKGSHDLTQHLLSVWSLDVAPHRLRGSLKMVRTLRLLAILDKVHELLSTGRHATLRELYYCNVSIFGRQRQSDEILKQLCCILKVPRHYLHVVGMSKGLVRGHLRILEPSLGSSSGPVSLWIDGMDALEPRGHLIPAMCAHVLRVESLAPTILVVEKETVFFRLLEEGFLERHRPVVIVTARGFPDTATRYFLRRFCEDCSSPRVLVLVDFDTFGLGIAATYAFGPEDSWIQDDLTLPMAVPLMCPAGQGRQFGLRLEDTMPLTNRDRATARRLQRRFETLRLEWGDRLAVWESLADALLEGGVKSELDALDTLSEFVDVSMRASPATAAGAVGV